MFITGTTKSATYEILPDPPLFLQHISYILLSLALFSYYNKITLLINRRNKKITRHWKLNQMKRWDYKIIAKNSKAKTLDDGQSEKDDNACTPSLSLLEGLSDWGSVGDCRSVLAVSCVFSLACDSSLDLKHNITVNTNKTKPFMRSTSLPYDTINVASLNSQKF